MSIASLLNHYGHYQLVLGLDKALQKVLLTMLFNEMCVDHKGKTKEFYKVFVLTRQQQQKITKTVTIYALGKTRQNWGT